MSGLSPVYGFLKQPSLVDFPGQLAAVLFVGGCNFRCGYCHNPNLLAPGVERMGWDRLGAACARFRDQWVTGAVISGGEPTLDPGLMELVAFLRKAGLAVKLDTNGSRPGVLREVLPCVDYVAMDVKTRPADYARLTGFGDVSAVMESIQLICRQGCDHEFRTTVVVGEHDESCIREIAGLLSGARRYVLQPFVPRARHVEERFAGVAQTPGPLLELLARVARGQVAEVLVRGG